MRRTTVVSQESVLKADLFEVYRTKIAINSGKEILHHTVYRDPVVCVFPITDNNEVCLISQYRYLYDEESLEEVAGFINKGEAPLAAAKRELKEETGISAKEWVELCEVRLAGSIIKAVAYLFVAKQLTFGESALEEDEEIVLKKIMLSQAVEKVLSNEINKATAMVGIFAIDKLREQGKI